MCRAADAVAAAEVKAAEEMVHAARRAIDAADAQVASASPQVQTPQATHEENRVTVRDTPIQSPTRGVVTKKVAAPGTVLAAGAPIAMLVDLDKLHIKAAIHQSEIGRIKVGDDARVYVDGFPRQPFAAKVAEITPQSATLVLDTRTDGRVVPGMPAQAVIRWKADAPWIEPLKK